MKWLATFLGLLLAANLSAQQLDWDIDSLFDEPPEHAPEAEAEAGASVLDELVRRRGFTFDASFEFALGVAPGWFELPWASGGNTDIYLDRAVKLRSSLGLDAQISEVFRVKTTVYYELPSFQLKLKDFYFDYNLYDAVFFRGGKYNMSWGISPNFHFTNLLSRVPVPADQPRRYVHDSFIFRGDVPVGIGGFQLLALTRTNLMSGGELPKLKDFGFGGKYNMALRQVDMDLGAYYQEEMPLRGFLSLKTTLWNTELYNEWMGALNLDDPANLRPSGAVNLGFAKDLFDKKFNVNGELFYNAEKNASWYRPETTLRDADSAPFVEGFNMAVNLLYRFGGGWNPRVFLQARYAPMQNSAQLVPGFRLNPWRHIEFYLAMPMALGSKDGYYYNNTVTTTADNPSLPLPFAVIFLVTLKGGVQLGHYY